MKKLFNVLLADRITRIAAIMSLSLLLITLGYTFLIYGNLPPFIPLFNQLGWGDPRLAERVFIFLPLIVALGILVINFFITVSVYTSLPLISRMIAITSLLTSALTLLFVIRVTQLIL